MNELIITVDQKPGIISTNFAEIKTALADQMQVYKELEVTEENKTDRKKDVATLRKMQKAITEKASEVRNKCLEPYNTFKKQADDLAEVINEPIKIINSQVEEFEEKQRLAKQADIGKVFGELITNYSTEIVGAIDLSTIYDAKWENVAVSMKSIRNDISTRLNKIQDEAQLIKSMVSDKTEEALRLFWGDLDVTKAITMINRYEAQKREIQARLEEQQRREKEVELERERQRVREEERRRIQEEEKIREEERQKAAAEEERIREEERQATEKKLMGIKASAEPVDLEAPFDADELPFVVPGDIYVKVIFTVTGTPFELQQVEMYLNSIGLEFRREDI